MGHFLIDDLRLTREGKGLSRSVLAARLGVDPQVVKRLEVGVGSVPSLIAVMKALDYHLSGLARGADLTDQIRRRRLNRALSIERVAERTGLARGTISKIERGEGSVKSALRLLDFLGGNARRRAPDRAHWLFDPTGGRDSRFSPPEFMEVIYTAFGEVDLDPCAHRGSPVRATRYIIQDEGGDGLTDDWSGRLVYMNPPFSAMLKWLRCAHDHWQSEDVETIVCLVPARTDSAWFHEHLLPTADIYMMKGRLRFFTVEGRGHQAPFPLMVVVFGGNHEQKTRLAELLPGFWLSR